MLSAHETVKTAWSNFKSYPRFWQVVLFSFVALLPSLLFTVYAGIDDPTSQNQLNGIFVIISSIPGYIVYFLMGMAITHYVCTGWIFNNFLEFLRPPSSRWKLFWKVFVFYIVMIVAFMIGAMAFGWVMAMLPTMAQFTIGVLVGFMMIGFIIFIFTKLILINPYFTMNDTAPLFAPLRFSDGYFWYLTKILGWMLLYGLLFFIAFTIVFALIGIGASMVGTIGIAIVTCASLILQTLATMLCIFIYSEAYKQIAENKP